MIIPVGLIAHLIGAAAGEQDDHAQLQFESYEREHQFETELHNQRVLGHELFVACTGQTGCLLVLGENDWAHTEIDHVRLSNIATAGAGSSSGGGYRETADPLGPGPHGFVAVCPGRHVIRTVVGGRAVDADVVLFPGEAVFRRLDRAARTWTTYDATMQQHFLTRLAAQQLVLLHYFEQVAEPRIKAMVGKSEHEALRGSDALVRSALNAIVAGDQHTAMQRVAAATKLLVGAPVRSFAAITSFIGYTAFELYGQGRVNEAWLLLQAGLAILPEEPALLAVLGEIQLSSGATDEGKATLQRALDRGLGLDARIQARVNGLLLG